MTWFKAHLNLTFLFAWLLGSFILVVGIPNFTIRGVLTGGGVVIAILAAIIVLGTEIWYLRQKRRSMFYLFLNFLSWIGFIILLCLENRAKKLMVKPDGTSNTVDTTPKV
jgi:hypothetical protein